MAILDSKLSKRLPARCWGDKVQILLLKIDFMSLRNPLATLYFRDATWVGGVEGREVIHGLIFKRYHWEQILKIGPLPGMVHLATNLGHSCWPCQLVAFMYLDVIWGME